MGKILSVTHNSKRSFLGGGKGALVPLRPPPKNPSETQEQESPLPESCLGNLREEAGEQCGASPSETTEKTDSRS